MHFEIEKFNWKTVLNILNGAFEPESEEGINREKFFRRILKKCSAGQGLAVDFACGRGSSTAALYKEGYNVIALDINRVYITDAKEKADKRNMKIDFVLMDMKELAFRREIFDIAAFLGDPISLFAPAISSAIFDQVYEILKPGGKIILNYRNWLELVQSSVLKKLGVKTYINYIDGKISLKHRRFEFDFYLYAPFILEYMLKKSGFVNIETKKFRTDGLILPQVVTIAIKQI